MNFFIIFICLFFTPLTFSREIQLNLNLLGEAKVNCVPKVESSTVCSDPNCCHEDPQKEKEIYKCKFVLKSKYCLKRKTKPYKEKTIVKGVEKMVTKYKWRSDDAEDGKNCLSKNYNVNVLLNKEAVFSKEPIDLTYFLHGKVDWGLVDEKVRRRKGKRTVIKGDVARYELEKQIRKVKKPIAFVYPEFITDNATKNMDNHHFSQFKDEDSWKTFQSTVEQMLGGEKRVSRRNLMAHSMAYAPVARMVGWSSLKFSSTTMIDSIYAKTNQFESIAQNYDRFGSFTSYGIYEGKDKRNSTYKNNEKLRKSLSQNEGGVHFSRSIKAKQSTGRVPSIISLKSGEEIRSPNKMRIRHPNISKYVYHQYLIQQGYLTSKEIYGR